MTQPSDTTPVPVPDATDAVDRRALLRGILGGAAALAGAAAVGTPNLARAAGIAKPTCDAIDFRTREMDKKRTRDFSSRKKADEMEKKKDQQVRQAKRYEAVGPAPAWIESDALDDVLTYEVELSSIDASGDGSFCTVTMDLTVDAIGSKVPLKDRLAPLYKLLPPAPGKDAPYSAITWGVDGDQALEGYLEKLVVAYTAYDEKGAPVRALVRTTWYG